jgi:trehalose-phosphatase
MARRTRKTSSTATSRKGTIPSRPNAAGGSPLFDHWTAVRRRLRSARQLALFLDFDGTLAPICSRPEIVAITPAMRQAVLRLAAHRRVKVFVVSGRRLPDVRKRVKVPAVTYLGLHGWERQKGRPKQTGTRRFIQRLRREVKKKLSSLDGIWVEDKLISFVVHYRLAPAVARRRARWELKAILRKVASRVRVMEGKKVWEVLPREVEGKGAAVLELLRGMKGRPLPIYAGDDTTDEAAFAALPDGVTIRVGKPRPTRARYRLRGPGEVRLFLERLEAEIA